MLVMTNELADAAAAVEEAQRDLSAAVEKRDAVIRGLKGTTGATEIARMTGISRGRVYQIWYEAS